MASKLVTAYEEASGRQVRVPEHYLGHPRLGAGLTTEKPDVEPVYDRSDPDAPGVSKAHTVEEISASVSGSAPESPVDIPEGAPTTDWTAKQLSAFADRAGLDLGGAKTKADQVAAIETGLTAGDPEHPDGDPSGEGAPGADQTDNPQE